METRKINADIFAVYPGEILRISEEIRIKSASESRIGLLLKDNLRRRSADNHQTQEAFDHTSKSDLPRNQNNSQALVFEMSGASKARINSAYSAYSTSKENTTCWRNIIKSDSLIFYRNLNDRITASEMCQFSGNDCKLCSAKVRQMSKSDDSKMELHNESPGKTVDNPFQRLTSPDKRVVVLEPFTNSKIPQNPSTDLFFMNLDDLKRKLFKSARTKERYVNLKESYRSAMLYEVNLRKYKKLKLNMNNFQRSEIALTPPIIPLIQQKKFNSFFVS